MKKALLVVASISLLAGCSHNRRVVQNKATDNALPQSALQEPAVPPQSHAAKDIEITQAIRRELIADKGFSVNAQNIKVATKNGQVTLFGAVDDRIEQSKVKQLVESVPGVVRVNDELDVLNSNVASGQGKTLH